MDWTIWGSNPGGDDIFRTRPERPWGPPSLLNNGYKVLRRPERGVDHPPHLAPRLKEEYSYTSAPPLGLRGLSRVKFSRRVCSLVKLLYLSTETGSVSRLSSARNRNQA